MSRKTPSITLVYLKQPRDDRRATGQCKRNSIELFTHGALVSRAHGTSVDEDDPGQRQGQPTVGWHFWAMLSGSSDTRADEGDFPRGIIKEMRLRHIVTGLHLL